MTSVTVDDVAWQNGKHIFEELKKLKRWRSEVTNPNFSSIGQGRVYSEDGSCGAGCGFEQGWRDGCMKEIGKRTGIRQVKAQHDS